MTVIISAAGCLAILAVAGYLHLGQRQSREVAKALPPPDVQQALAESLRTFRQIRGRVWAALFRGLLLISIYAFVILALGGGAFVLSAGHRLPDAHLSIGWWETLPGVARYAGYFTVIGLVVCVLIGILFQFRIVDRIREGGPVRWKDLVKELDVAIGRGGIFPTLLFGGAVTVLAAGWLGAWAIAGQEIERMIGISTGTGLFLGLAIGGVAAWLFSIPLVLTFGVLASRDPGWLSALEASIGVTLFHHRDMIAAALYVTLLAGSVVYWPAAIWFILSLVEDQLPLVCSLLRERPQRDILREISDYQPAQESALRSADDFLAEGRYLDALNQYQMFYFKNPMHTGALERIVAAQLHIGNRQKAREALERLLILDPENEEARRRLEEVQQGRWSEEGDLFQAAQQRNKQVLGKGVELRDTIAPEVLREFQKEE
jgi:hypothetical protein